MSRKSFLTVADGSTVTFDADLAKSFQVTLGGNRSLVIAGGQEGDEISILLIQDGTGSRVPTWGSNVSWFAGQAPNLTSIAGGSDLITLFKRGSTWQDKSGAPSRLPARIRDAGLGTIIGVAATVLTLSLSSGTSSRGNLPDALRVTSQSGAELDTRVDGTGSVLVGSGILAVHSVDSRGLGAKFKVLNNGTTTIKATLSGADIINTKQAVTGSTLVCVKPGGQYGVCGGETIAGGKCTCR